VGCSGQSCCCDGMGVGPAQVPELGRGLSCTVGLRAIMLQVGGWALLWGRSGW